MTQAERPIINTDIAVIGAGPVGLFTVFQAGMLGYKCTVIDALDHIGGQCTALYPEKPIYDIPAYPAISGAELIDKLSEQAAPFTPQFLLSQSVIELKKSSDGGVVLTTSKHQTIHAKGVIIAAGAGAFGPNRPPLDGIEAFEGTSVFYSVLKHTQFLGKRVLIAGGGDSAVDWANALCDAGAQVTVVHRRDVFRAAPHSVAALHDKERAGTLILKTGYQLKAIEGNAPTLSAVVIESMDGERETIACDVLLPFYGLSTHLGALADWGFDIHENKQITVNPITQETAIPHVFAVGDICHYPEKLRLILTGFAESATACHAFLKAQNPGKDFHFEYSTTKGVKGL